MDFPECGKWRSSRKKYSKHPCAYNGSRVPIGGGTSTEKQITPHQPLSTSRLGQLVAASSVLGCLTMLKVSPSPLIRCMNALSAVVAIWLRSSNLFGVVTGAFALTAFFGWGNREEGITGLSSLLPVPWGRVQRCRPGASVYNNIHCNPFLYLW
jgi:hypothetical protein